MLRSSPSWPQIGSPGLSGKEDDKDSVLSGDWIDKVMVNKQENASGEENLLGIGCWDVDNRQLPEMFGPSSLPDPPKLYMENQNFGKLMANKEESQDYEVQRSQYEAATTDDSDELEAATSDCSEPDMLWQLNPPKVTGIPNGLGAKPKKPYPRPVRSPETR